MTERDPFPFPQLENDDNFVKNGQSFNNSEELNLSGNKVTLSPGEKKPWERLHNTKTLSSQRHEVYHYDPKEPIDNLDFVLKCQYDHHYSFMSSKAESLLQKETLGVDHGRILKNRPVVPEPVTLETKELVTHCQQRKTTIDCSKGLSIESHHSEATNRGYSRKQDGGFYST